MRTCPWLAADDGDVQSDIIAQVRVRTDLIWVHPMVLCLSKQKWDAFILQNLLIVCVLCVRVRKLVRVTKLRSSAHVPSFGCRQGCLSKQRMKSRQWQLPCLWLCQGRAPFEVCYGPDRHLLWGLVYYYEDLVRIYNSAQRRHKTVAACPG